MRSQDHPCSFVVVRRHGRPNQSLLVLGLLSVDFSAASQGWKTAALALFAVQSKNASIIGPTRMEKMDVWWKLAA